MATLSFFIFVKETRETQQRNIKHNTYVRTLTQIFEIKSSANRDFLGLRTEITRACLNSLMALLGPEISALAISGAANAPNCSEGSYDVCPMNYIPLCGTDGITYGNECMMCGFIK
ncbi:putative pancreatic secretory proteinase inhibitor PSTI type [Triplophysa tibetana]|uniref:Putative pancreatic secretory proteinase inhibitor PSTI type n=1 Tax=Triplophysa tibetana TaxID=1572043 RepID=A0A5A9NLP3_9TELE|nr:putative pancreatic secretory proteinase inhibitor PSTI type [Triplophysa tibetana]